MLVALLYYLLLSYLARFYFAVVFEDQQATVRHHDFLKKTDSDGPMEVEGEFPGWFRKSKCKQQKAIIKQRPASFIIFGYLLFNANSLLI